MVNLKKFFFGNKSVPVFNVISEETREGLNKAYIPKFLYKPPYGYPRYTNMAYIRYLAKTPYVEMSIDTILKEIGSIDWNIYPNPAIPTKMADELFMDDDHLLKDDVQAEIQHIKTFLDNPNTNPDEDFESLFIKQCLRDVYEINSGIINKVYNRKEQMVELVSRDGATFTRNPDVHGMYTDRADIILPKEIINNISDRTNFNQISSYQAKEKAAYFQYGWISGPVPQPFGKKEIIWFEDMKRSDDIYAYSRVQILGKALQMLLYHIESDLEYYNKNNVPKGIIGIEGSDSDELDSFKKQWNEIQRTKDQFGNYKQLKHQIPILNVAPKFERIEFSSQEIQLIEKQRWYSKMVWASFGITPTELGYTEDSSGQSNQIVQSKVFKKKAINPNLRMIAKKINSSIIPEFNYNVKVKIGNKELEIQKYVFKFNTFDIDEEKSKAELYDMWTEIGYKTVNEIKIENGLKPVEWGDERPQRYRDQGSNFSFGSDNFTKKESTALETDDNLDREKKIQSLDKNVKKTEKQINNTKSNDLKAQNYSSPLLLKENEVITENDLTKAINFILKENERKILDLIKKNITEDKLKEIKSEYESLTEEDFSNIEIKGLNDMIKLIKSLISFDKIKPILNKLVRKEFLQGAIESEDKINKVRPFNYMPEDQAIKYIEDYTFDNIKDINKTLEDKLRQTLQRGFMNGEGVPELTSKVKEIFDIQESRAEAIVRTESSRAFSFGKLSAYKQSGIEARKWLLWTDDNRTSEISRVLHKKYGSEKQSIPLNENFKASVKVGKKMVYIDQPCPPFHINERDDLIIEPVI